MIVRILITICLATLLASCGTPPLQPQVLDHIFVGQARDAVLEQLHNKPCNVVHTSYDGDDYMAYFYRMQTGETTNTICKGKKCTQKSTSIAPKYAFIYRNSNNPRLAYFGFVSDLAEAYDGRLRMLMQQLHIVSEPPRSE